MALVYVAVLKDYDGLTDVMTVQSDRNDLETYVKDYFGISENKHYDNPAEFLGYTKIEYSEFEDDLEGFYKFKQDEDISEVLVYCKSLNEKP
jgi:hypothetical protein